MQAIVSAAFLASFHFSISASPRDTLATESRACQGIHVLTPVIVGLSKLLSELESSGYMRVLPVLQSHGLSSTEPPTKKTAVQPEATAEPPATQQAIESEPDVPSNPWRIPVTGRCGAEILAKS